MLPSLSRSGEDPRAGAGGTENCWRATPSVITAGSGRRDCRLPSRSAPGA